MEFIREAELFFIQLQYGLDKGAEPRMPDGTSFAEVESPVFLKYIEDYGIECPFIPKNKIIELITLMQKDNISPKKALEILHNFKKQYWVFDSKVRVHKVGEHFIEGIKAKLTFMSEPEIIEFFYTFLEYTSEKRELIYADLVNEINKLQSALPTQQIATDTCMPPFQKEKERKHAEKWYALYHMILIEIGKQVPRLSSGSKSEKIKYGREQYGTGQGFYREMIKIDLNTMSTYIRSLPPKDRYKGKWKNIISEISNNDADVISWLNKQPN